jgi:RNA polymerase sigma-70 factor, ECF subfamily
MSLSVRSQLPHFVSEALRADPAALGAFLEHFRAYFGLLARLQLGRHIAGRLDASDVVQEIFLRATRDIAEFRGASEADLLAWMRTILAHTIADEARRINGRIEPALEAELLAAIDRSSMALDGLLVSPGSSPSQHASRREQAVLTAHALMQLPQHYREVLVLRYLEELPFAEVAQRMGRSLDSVKKLWIRALATLRQSRGGMS